MLTKIGNGFSPHAGRYHFFPAISFSIALSSIASAVSVRLSPPCNSDRKEFLVEPDILLTWRQQEPPTRREAQEW